MKINKTKVTMVPVAIRRRKKSACHKTMTVKRNNIAFANLLEQSNVSPFNPQLNLTLIIPNHTSYLNKLENSMVQNIQASVTSGSSVS